MTNILIVDDSKLITNALKSLITERLGFNCVVANSMKSAADVLLQYKGNFEVALLDLGLPDAPNGEVVDFITKFQIPTIVLTGSECEEEKFRHKNIVDYVIKDSSYSLEYAMGVVKRIVSNKNIKALVVDDSKITCEKIASLLKRYQLQTFTACSSKECLEVLDKNPDIKVIYIDYIMPDVNGLSLTREIRYRYSKDEVSIIALSGEANKKVISKFLKYGANDFIYKGFTEEEFFVRLNSNLEILELFQNAKHEVKIDYLTGIYNRRYLFDEGELTFQKAKREEFNFSIAILDIDKFKAINDTWGHSIGDLAIKEVVNVLDGYVNEKTIPIRLGGEEFCILIQDKDYEQLNKLLENVRDSFEENVLKIDDIEITFTVSFGVCNILDENLNNMLNNADKALYSAKRSGRNKVVFYES